MIALWGLGCCQSVIRCREGFVGSFKGVGAWDLLGGTRPGFRDSGCSVTHGTVNPLLAGDCTKGPPLNISKFGFHIRQGSHQLFVTARDDGNIPIMLL